MAVKSVDYGLIGGTPFEQHTFLLVFEYPIQRGSWKIKNFRRVWRVNTPQDDLMRVDT